MIIKTRDCCDTRLDAKLDQDRAILELSEASLSTCDVQFHGEAHDVCENRLDNNR